MNQTPGAEMDWNRLLEFVERVGFPAALCAALVFILWRVAGSWCEENRRTLRTVRFQVRRQTRLLHSLADSHQVLADRLDGLVHVHADRPEG